ncbi:NAD-binding protein [Fomitiporia mediterranea MF3/22]|uniref:NAD-binding protein n=1 Tax=Fomitiporia mediterranea (strain MF3/22) TaxID=694068 RepID=UPI00044089C2|nr:NAD-binding protein [Fomitiporia mediterranea MF3/22]EJD00132.1 NAD-binding protein [Fomitiporia mediterranea MF3/22]
MSVPAHKQVQKESKDRESPQSSRKVALSDRFSMKNKVCLVTGAARGLGYEFCRAFIEMGCTSLAVLDMQERAAQEAAAELVESSKRHWGIENVDAVGFGCNVASERSVEDTFKNVVAHFKKIDAVVASAGIVENYSALEYPSDRAKLLFDVNYHGAFFTARESAKYMIPNGGGSIVLIASMSADIVNVPQPQAPYNASKAAVKQLASSLAVEWARKNVRVNALSPGYMQTRLTRKVLEQDDEVNRKWKSMTPMGRLGEPDDLDGAVVFLSSDAARFITGAELLVDGGYSVI